MTSFLSRHLVLLGLFLTATGLPAQQPGTSPVKIYILAGQSNMVGQGNMSPATTPGTLEYTVANDPGGDYQFVSDGAGGWASFDDVWIHYERTTSSLLTGDLSAGSGGSATTIGPELSFGHFVGDLDGNQVLLIKACWGGRSLAVDFRPPSSGPYPTPTASGDTGFYYHEILRVVNDAISNLGTYFPDYNAAGGYEIAGFGWHQGWNDHISPTFTAEYEANLANFIRDIRADLGSPFPFVIATSGMASGGAGGSAIELAQIAVGNPTNHPDFDGNVTVVETHGFWRDPSVSPVPNGTQGFHWNRNAATYLDIGLAMGEAMTALVPVRCPSTLRAEGGSGGVTLTWLNGSETPTSVQVLRNGVEIASAAPAVPSTFLDTGAAPGSINYEIVFTMPVTPCPSLTTTFDSCIGGLEALRTEAGVVLTWDNQLTYAGIEIRRDGMLLEASLSGTAETYTDPSPPFAGLATYTVVSTNGSCPPASTVINLNPPSVGGPVLFADTFDRANSTDLNAPATGKSGSLGALNYTARTFNTVSLDISSNSLRINGPASNGSFGGLVFINDHNFTDAAITSGGGFSVGVDLAAYSTAGSGRQMTVGVGQSLADLNAQSGVAPGDHVSDLLVAYRGTTDSLEIYKNGNLDSGETITGGLPTAPATMRIEYSLSDFNAGSTVAYNVFFDDSLTAFASGSFTWSGTNENYLSLSSNLSNDARFDNLEIRGGEAIVDEDPPNPPDPMSWAIPPAAAGEDRITMTATTANDPSGVEYFFTNTTVTGHDSGWQDSPSWTDTGLDASTSYSYTVKARDKSPTATETGVSTPAASATTDAFVSGVLFADNFDRPDAAVTGGGISTDGDINGTNAGKSGSLGNLTWTARAFAGNTFGVVDGALTQVDGPNSVNGGLAYINDHNFTDAIIASGGGFSITIDIVSYNTAGSGRYWGIGVGQSLADFDGLTSNDNVASTGRPTPDLWVGYRNTTDDLEIWNNGVLNAAETVTSGLPNAPTTPSPTSMRVRP